MARKIFFSFHYERDSWRAGQVRNCNVISTGDEYGFIDSVEWEEIKKHGDAAIRKWIENQMDCTSVTVVLIGAETAGRPWVQHEIVKSWNRGNGLVGVWIHNVKDCESKVDIAGKNPLDAFKLPNGVLLSSICRTYDWVIQDGGNNLGTWIEEAYQERVKYGSEDSLLKVGDAGLGQPGFMRTVAASGGFTPRAPWCQNDPKPRR